MTETRDGEPERDRFETGRVIPRLDVTWLRATAREPEPARRTHYHRA